MAQGGSSAGSTTSGGAGAAGKSSGGSGGDGGGASPGGTAGGAGLAPFPEEVPVCSGMTADAPCGQAGVQCIDMSNCGTDKCRRDTYGCANGLWREVSSESCGPCTQPEVVTACSIDQATGDYLAAFARISGNCAPLAGPMAIEQGKWVPGMPECAVTTFSVSVDKCSAETRVHCQLGEDSSDLVYLLIQRSADASILEGQATLMLKLGASSCSANYLGRFDKR